MATAKGTSDTKQYTPINRTNSDRPKKKVPMKEKQRRNDAYSKGAGVPQRPTTQDPVKQDAVVTSCDLGSDQGACERQNEDRAQGFSLRSEQIVQRSWFVRDSRESEKP